MKLSKCDNGHFYDSDKYPECPYCNTDLQKDTGGIVVSARAVAGAAPGEPAAPQAPATPAGPVTGWLVALNGPHAGCDYRLGEGRSFFGLEDGGAPCPLSADAALSARLLTLAYDPAGGEFTALPGAGQTLAYINGKANLTPQPLKNGDEVALGDTKLRFVAFCGGFRWPKAVRGKGAAAPKAAQPAPTPAPQK
ncbi:MAG: FHA domain-containing protein [Gemmiger sp.]|nr:FHA domain-containing protein [Gemmiger sp.]